MRNRLLSILLIALFIMPAFAGAQTQERKKTYGGRISYYTSPVTGDRGGVEGTVVNRNGRAPIADASLQLYRGTELIAEGPSDSNGYFLFSEVDNGDYRLVVTAMLICQLFFYFCVFTSMGLFSISPA